MNVKGGAALSAALFGGIEGLAIVAVAVALARLFWIAVTPAGPLGEWRAPAAESPPRLWLGGPDPFVPPAAAGQGPAVTALDMVLVGTRVDLASGRGGAIIAFADGRQQSFVVGETVQPDVTLQAVAFDSVTLRNGGRDEQLFLDQSAAPAATPSSPALPSAPATTSPPAVAVPQ